MRLLLYHGRIALSSSVPVVIVFGSVQVVMLVTDHVLLITLPVVLDHVATTVVPVDTRVAPVIFCVPVRVLPVMIDQLVVLFSSRSGVYVAVSLAIVITPVSRSMIKLPLRIVLAANAEERENNPMIHKTSNFLDIIMW